MKLILFFSTLLFSTFTFAQTSLSGKIIDLKKNPIAAANIYVEGTYDGATTNASGEFKFETTVIGKQILVITNLGFETLKLPIIVENYQFLTIVLKPSANQLDEVVISAGTLESGDKSRVSVLKPLDILTTAGNPGDIVSALQTLPGTQVVGESGRLFVRGGDATETQTFIDGIRVAQPYIQTTNNVPTRSTFSPLLFKGTSFSTGGYSAEYGEALSSILVMNTIDIPDVEKTEIGLMSLGLALGNTQKWKNKSLSFNTSYINLAPYQAILPDFVKWNKAFESIGGETVFRNSFERGLLKIYASFTSANFDVKQTDINFPDMLRVKNANTNLYTNASYKGKFGSNWKIFAGLSYAYNSNKGIFDINNFSNSENAIHSKFLITKNIANKVKTSFGSEFYNTNLTEGFNSLNRDLNTKIFAAYSETDILFNSNLIAKVGLRFSQNYLLNQNSISPRLALAYKIAKNKQFSMAYGNFDQTPRKDYLVFDKNLELEKAQHYILNYEFTKDKQIFKAELYYKNYDNLIKFDTPMLISTSNFNNNGNGFAKGAELFWRDSKNIKNLEYWVSYSWIDSKRDYQNFRNEATPNFVANHTLSVVSKLWIPKWRSQLGTTYTFASGRPYDDPNSTQFLASKTKSYNNFSANWAYLISPQKILFFSVTNVFGIKNVFGYNYSQTPNATGVFERQAVIPTADRFFFVGYFWTISKDKKQNQLENL